MPVRPRRQIYRQGRLTTHFSVKIDIYFQSANLTQLNFTHMPTATGHKNLNRLRRPNGVKAAGSNVVTG